MNFDVNKIVKILKQGGIVVAPTDTIYGILASALNKKSVERVYKVKGRDENKPFIILITDLNDLKKFSIKLTQEEKDYFSRIWPRKVSIEIRHSVNKFSYLHRNFGSNAFRMVGPKNKKLYQVLKKTGPLIAPSANPQGLEPAKNISQAKKYFGNKVDMYTNGGTKISKPSTLIRFKNGNIEILRQGSVKIKTSR